MIKNLTYHNLMVVINKLMAKGWNREESEKMARNMFAEFKARPLGMSIEERIRRTLTREEWEEEQRRWG